MSFLTIAQIIKRKNLWANQREIIVDFLCLSLLFFYNLFWLKFFFNYVGYLGPISAPFLLFIAKLALLIKPALDLGFFLTRFVLLTQLVALSSCYLFFKELTNRRLPGLMVAFIYSLPLPLLGADRVRQAIIYGDAAHLVAVSFFPAFIYFFLRFLKEGGLIQSLLAIIVTATVALISPFAFFNLLFWLLVIFFSEIILGQARLKLARAVFILLISWLMVSFWYTPGFVFRLLTSPQARVIIDLFFKFIPLSFFMIPLLLIVGYLLFESRPGLQPIVLVLSLFVVYGSFILMETFGRANLKEYVLLPHRFLPEFGLSLAFLLGILSTIILDALSYLEISSRNYFVQLLLPSEAGSKAKRGVNLFLLLLIWFCGMLIVYLLFPINDLKSQLQMLGSSISSLNGSLDFRRQLCYYRCPGAGDHLIGLLLTIFSLVLVVFLFVQELFLSQRQ